MVVHFLLLNCHRSSGAAMHRTHVYPYMHASSFASGTNCRVHAIGCGTFLPALAVVVQYLQHSAVALYMSACHGAFTSTLYVVRLHALQLVTTNALSMVLISV